MRGSSSVRRPRTTRASTSSAVSAGCPRCHGRFHHPGLRRSPPFRPGRRGQLALGRLRHGRPAAVRAQPLLLSAAGGSGRPGPPEHPRRGRRDVGRSRGRLARRPLGARRGAQVRARRDRRGRSRPPAHQRRCPSGRPAHPHQAAGHGSPDQRLQGGPDRRGRPRARAARDGAPQLRGEPPGPRPRGPCRHRRHRLRPHRPCPGHGPRIRRRPADRLRTASGPRRLLPPGREGDLHGLHRCQ